jgi:glycosyltransferase involved in cell wall biosynthesis
MKQKNKILLRIRAFGVLKREYLEEAVLSLSLSPFLTALFNLFVIFLVMVKRVLKRLVRGRQSFGIATIQNEQDKLVNLVKREQLPDRIKILLIVEESIPHCFRYRVKQKMEQLELMEYDCEWVSWKNYAHAANRIHFYHVVLFYRVPGFDSVVDLMNLAHSLNKAVLFDVDDLIFNKKIMQKHIRSLKSVSEKERKELVHGTELYSKAIEKADFLISSTPSLCKQLESYDGRVFLHRNGLDSENVHCLNSVFPEKEREYVSILYGSGTKTHNADFQIAAPALVRILGEYDNVRLIIVGSLDLSEEFCGLEEKIVRISMMSNQAYMELLKVADISLAPLESGVFTDSKSEIKWLEAAVFRVPSVVSATITYEEILVDGENGFICSSSEQWYEKLSLLVNDRSVRTYIGENAFKTAQKEYSPKNLALNLEKIIRTAAIDVYSKTGEALIKQKRKIVFVNVLYPPYALGGATVMVTQSVEILSQYYGDEFDVSVVTTVPGVAPYEVLEYEHGGVHVFGIGVPAGIDLEWRYNDVTIYQIFKDYISLKEPDFIHFHSIQRLTGSILKATHDSNIPFAVTLHDSWWFCDRQFMVDAKGIDCGQFQVDPFVCAECLDDSNGSIQRRAWLSEQLKKADCLFAVSEYQKKLYEANGFTNVLLNYNGISVGSEFISKEKKNEKIVLGYAGGICEHKGYYLLKDALIRSNVSNIEVIIIDVAQQGGRVRKEQWGGVDVSVIPGIPFSEMAGFYSSIDILIAPSLCRESFGLTVREALYYGIWVVAAHAGALSEDIQDGINGNVFTKGDGDELAAILEKIDADPDSHRPESDPDSDRIKIRRVEEQVGELADYYRKIICSSKDKAGNGLQEDFKNIMEEKVVN